MFDDPSGRIAGRFTRVEPRRRARAFVLGLLADLPCMNCRASPSTLGTWPPSGGRWVSAAGMVGQNSSAVLVNRMQSLSAVAWKPSLR